MTILSIIIITYMQGSRRKRTSRVDDRTSQLQIKKHKSSAVHSADPDANGCKIKQPGRGNETLVCSRVTR